MKSLLSTLTWLIDWPIPCLIQICSKKVSPKAGAVQCLPSLQCSEAGCEPDISAQDWCGLFITSHKLNRVEWITPTPPATLLTIETAKFCKQKKIHMKCLCRINNIIVVFCFLNNVQNAVIYYWLTHFSFIISFSFSRWSFCNLRRFQLPNFSLLSKSH